ncbi:bifunctional 3-oxoadipate enol-lactonase/4-carboxymuconolactone decarboxylase PcaDC [Actinophytocola gossypii]|uniref:3-oxoadipate enol-lactonase n=1 Tax=Actinophytocola gossypii TaxID=2812003 RepID=A0ABT2J3I4_9PSEU|nr:3-oxoadipate enol-lactonase [Actinophytocola gossypii]
MTLFHEVRGPSDGPVVVLSGALGTDLTMWDQQVDALVGAGFRVVRYDHRGHGRSPAPPGPYTLAELAGDLVALLDRLGIARVSYVGLSLGGMVGMWLAAHEPARVERLVLCCTSARLGPPDMWLDRARAARESGMEPLADAAVGRWLTPGADAGLAARLRRMVAATPAEGYASCCDAIRTMTVEDDLGSVRVPTLVIAGAEDRATPPEHARRIVEAVPGARLAVVEGAAHLGNTERPAEFTELILAHLRPSRYATGMAVRRAVLGDEHVDRAVAGTTEFTRPFQEYVTESAWGGVWARPGLDRRTRSAVTLGALTALRAFEELPMHVRAAVRNGLTPAEIAEILLHTAVYAGAPAANTAFAIARETLDDLD